MATRSEARIHGSGPPLRRNKPQVRSIWHRPAARLSMLLGCFLILASITSCTEPLSSLAENQQAIEVSVTPSVVSLTVGSTVQLTGIVSYGAGDTQFPAGLSWASSNESVAQVSGTGLVMGTGEGSATITATLDGVSGSAVVSVSGAGSLEINTSTTGANLDPDGYTVTLDGSQSQSIGVNGSVTFDDLAEGTHSVQLTGLVSNCSVNGSNPRDVDIPAGGSAQATFNVVCSASTGDLQVTASTTGSDLDPNGYTVVVDGSHSQSIQTNGSVTFDDLAEGTHSVQLAGVAANCTVGGSNPRNVDVPAGGAAQTTFNVTCQAASTGSLQVTTVTAGSNLDPDGYTVVVDGAQSQSIATNGNVTFNGLTSGTHSVQLIGVAGNCSVVENPQNVDVPPDGAASTTFDVNCSGGTGGACEAQGGGSCWYVAPGGSDSNSGTDNSPFGTPQHAVNVAGPGDFIYLRGGIYNSGFDTQQNHGAAGALITIKSSPGETAIIRETIRANANYWRIENLKIEGGQIGQSFFPNLHDIWIVGNEISGHVADLGNNGLIQLTGNVAPDPWNIFIYDNVLHDLRGPSGQSWDQDPDREHHGCITVLQGSGLIEIKNNDISRCASAFYFKFPWNGPVVVEGNLIHDTQQFGQMRNANSTFRYNVVWGMGRGPTTQTDDATGHVYERNTFVALTPALDLNNLSSHASLNNVIFGASYLGGSGSPGGAQLDGNCFITPATFDAYEGLSLEQFQSQYGKELNSVRIVETSQAAVFANPASDDYRLIGTAATLCANKGAP